MNFTELTIDGFGAWSGLELRDLSPELNVFYGPNEAGKTTLLHFIRGVLYGFSAERRARYLPPLDGGPAGGRVGLARGHETYHLHRLESQHDPLGEATLTSANGQIDAVRQLPVLLGDVDEIIFQNVFAIGLDEIQHLGTLDDTHAARMLFDLSAGLDRVSLVEVLRELESSRHRLLDPSDRPSVIADLAAQRDRLHAELEQMAAATRRHWRLGSEHDELANSITRAEQAVEREERQARLTDLAASIAPQWDARDEFDKRLAVMGSASNFPPDALARMKRLTSALGHRRKRLGRIARLRKSARAAAAAVSIRQTLWKQAPRIQALAEHESWLASVEEEFRKAEKTVAQWEARHTAGRGKVPDTSDSLSHHVADLSPERLAALRAPAADLRKAHKAFKESREAAARMQQQSGSKVNKVAETLAAKGHEELKPALEQAGAHVAHLRRRVQVDDRIDKMSRHKADLEEQHHDLLERQVLHPRLMAILGAVFVVGALFLIGGLFLPASMVGSFGWPLALIGFLALLGAAATKWMLEDNAARQLHSCQKQLALLDKQHAAAHDERTTLDQHLADGGGPPAAQLQKAEADLSQLEELIPHEAKIQATQQDLETAQQRSAQTRDELRGAHRRWRAALAAAGLPTNLSPKQVRHLAGHHSQLGEIERQWLAAVEERDRRARELAGFSARLDTLFADAELEPADPSPTARLRQLRRELKDEEGRVAERRSLRRRLRLLHRRGKKHRLAIRQIGRRRLALLRAADAADEADFTHRATAWETVAALVAQRDALNHQLSAACAGPFGEHEVAALLSPAVRGELPSHRQQAANRLSAARAELRRLCEQRGELSHQLRTLADDRLAARKQLELATVEQRLSDALDRWQVLAVTSHVLHSLKEDYERNRQPEALRETSKYFAELTGGRYRRVWTALGDEALHIDDASGRPLGVEALSRGTREQLFLSLRLALVGMYARRGAAMPLVLDDVLVNFDSERSARAASVLRDFAAAGHQLLVFTCHEHMARLFKQLDVRVRRLPSRDAQPEAFEPVEELAVPVPPEPEPPPPRRRRLRPKPPEPVAIVPAPPPPPIVIEEWPPRAVVEEPPTPVIVLPEPVREVPRAELLEPVEPLRTNHRRHRADLPHAVAVARHIRHRWSAEEFEGELDDRVAEGFLGQRGATLDLGGDTSDI